MGSEKTREKTGQPPAAALNKAPVAKNKWVTASVVDDAAEVLRDVFEEAERRDPTHTRTWVALVDGNNHQIDRIETEAADRGVAVTVVVDLIHVLEYLGGRGMVLLRRGRTRRPPRRRRSGHDGDARPIAKGRLGRLGRGTSRLRIGTGELAVDGP